MEEEYTTFRTFNSIDEATPVLEILNSKGIEAKAVTPANNLNSSFGGIRNPYEVQVLVKINEFNAAEEALIDAAKQTASSADKDHYLSGFTDAELMEVLAKPDEWSEEDYLLAQQMLKERGHQVNDATLQNFKVNRLEELRRPERADRLWIFIGYVSALLGGLLGIFIGWLYMTTKKLLPNGERVYAYDESSRREARRIFVFGVFALVVFVILAIIHFVNSNMVF